MPFPLKKELIKALKNRDHKKIFSLLENKEVQDNINLPLGRNHLTLLFKIVILDLGNELFSRALELKADITAKTTNKETILTCAARFKRLYAIKQIVNHPDAAKIIDIPDADNDTALHIIAEEFGDDPVTNKAAMKLLLQAGANPLLPRLDGRDVLNVLTRECFNPFRILRPYLNNFTNSLDSDTQRFIKQAYTIKKAGHILGLSQEVMIRLPNSSRKKPLLLSNNSNLFSAQFMIEYLEQYIENEKPDGKIKEYFNTILNACREEKNFITDDRGNKLDLLISRIKKGSELVLFSAGNPWHTFMIGFYKNHMVVCDRRQSGDGILIAKFDPNLMTPKFFRTLRQYTHSLSSLNALFNDLINILESDRCKIIYKLAISKQHHPTCTFVNRKSLVYGILTLFIALDGGDVFSTDEYASSLAYYEYKHFSDFIRNYKVNNILNVLQNSIDADNEMHDEDFNSEDEKSVSLQILLAYLSEHHAQKSESSLLKINSEKERVVSILKILSLEISNHSENNPSYFFNNIKDIRIILIAAFYTENILLIKKLLESEIIKSKKSLYKNQLIAFGLELGLHAIIALLSKDRVTRGSLNFFSSARKRKQNDDDKPLPKEQKNEDVLPQRKKSRAR